jgi:hypothetical protein
VSGSWLDADKCYDANNSFVFRVEREQLAAIFKLLKEQEQTHAEPIALDEGELKAQLNLYR